MCCLSEQEPEPLRRTRRETGQENKSNRAGAGQGGSWQKTSFPKSSLPVPVPSTKWAKSHLLPPFHSCYNVGKCVVSTCEAAGGNFSLQTDRSLAPLPSALPLPLSRPLELCWFIFPSPRRNKPAVVSVPWPFPFPFPCPPHVLPFHVHVHVRVPQSSPTPRLLLHTRNCDAAYTPSSPSHMLPPLENPLQLRHWHRHRFPLQLQLGPELCARSGPRVGGSRSRGGRRGLRRR